MTSIEARMYLVMICVGIALVVLVGASSCSSSLPPPVDTPACVEPGLAGTDCDTPGPAPLRTLEKDGVHCAACTRGAAVVSGCYWATWDVVCVASCGECQ